MIQKFYSEARHCPHLSKALIIDPLAVELWTLCLIHRIPLKFSLYIRIKNVCPLLLNVTFGPFKEINLKEKKKWSKISENQNFIWFSQFVRVKEMLLVLFEWYFVYPRYIAVKTFLYLFIDEILFLPNIGWPGAYIFRDYRIHKYPGDNCPGLQWSPSGAIMGHCHHCDPT